MYSIAVNMNLLSRIVYVRPSLQYATSLLRTISSSSPRSTRDVNIIRGFSTNHWPSDDDHNNAAATVQSTSSSLRIPPHAAHKVCTAMDAVSLISRGDTLA